QNAAMFEETTAASHALTREAEALTSTMARFETGVARADPARVLTGAPFGGSAQDPAPDRATAPNPPPVAHSGAALAIAPTTTPPDTQTDPEHQNLEAWEEF
ncbi:hypothetical protein ACXYMP_11910, partial [Aliiroseovarius sp. CAU 1755]